MQFQLRRLAAAGAVMLGLQAPWTQAAQTQVAPPSNTLSAGISRSTHVYALPAVQLQSAGGRALPLAQALDDGRPVVMTFMFTSCQTVCPITNQVMVALGDMLGERRHRVNLVSISIDPDHDSVQKLGAYARRTGNRGSFFTADPGSSEAVQRAFNSWRGDKMHHEPAFFISRPVATGRQWVRLEGLVTPNDLLKELSTMAPHVLQR